MHQHKHSANKMCAVFALTGILSLALVTTAQARPVRHVHVKPVVHTERVVVKTVPSYRVINVLATPRITLPLTATRVLHKGEYYYYHDGVYFKKEPRGYVVVRLV